jgi:hypothetical protein
MVEYARDWLSQYGSKVRLVEVEQFCLILEKTKRKDKNSDKTKFEAHSL